MRSRVAVALLGSALALGACGGDEPEAAAEGQAEALGEVRVGSVAQLVQCRDWTKGERDQQLATIEQIKEQINLEDGTGETPELSDDAAFEVLDNTCDEEFAAGFRLYKIYARATSFAAFAQ